MTAKNDITGDAIRSRSSSQKYIDNYDKIFRKPNENITDAINDSPSNDVSWSGEKQDTENCGC